MAGRVAAALVGLLAPLLALEIVFRLAGAVVPGQYETTRLVAASEAFGRQNMANRAGWKRSAEYRVHVRVNSQGLRGGEVAYQKPPGVFRVLVVGDSFTFAAQVDEHQTFVTRLGEELRAADLLQGGPLAAIETINAGVDGWTTANELAWLSAEGLRYEPDLVVLLFFTGNDPGENYDFMKAVKRVGVDLAPTASLPASELRQTLADTSALYAFLETGILSRLHGGLDPSDLAELSDTTELQVRRSSDPERHEVGWQLSRNLLGETRALLDAHTVPLFVVGIPTVEHVVNAERPPTPFSEITDAARVASYDLLQPFRAAPDTVRDAIYFPKDRHWTATGHAEAARLVAAELLHRGLIHDDDEET